MPGDVTTMKIEAIQLGYMCCVQLKNSQKQGEFEKQLLELEILIPDLEQAKIKVKTFQYTKLPYSVLPLVAMYNRRSTTW